MWICIIMRTGRWVAFVVSQYIADFVLCSWDPPLTACPFAWTADHSDRLLHHAHSLLPLHPRLFASVHPRRSNGTSADHLVNPSGREAVTGNGHVSCRCVSAGTLPLARTNHSVVICPSRRYGFMSVPESTKRHWCCTTRPCECHAVCVKSPIVRPMSCCMAHDQLPSHRTVQDTP